jgi:hypothetical protein
MPLTGNDEFDLNSKISRAEAAIRLQLLLLDSGAQIRNDIPDDWTWRDIEARLIA